MQTFLQKKLFLVFTGCLIFVAVSFFGNDISVRAAPSPPIQVNCKDSGAGANPKFFCKGDKPTASYTPGVTNISTANPYFAVPFTPAGISSSDCVNTCKDAGGSGLRWDNPLGKPQPPDQYCFGATQQKACTITVKDAQGNPIEKSINIVTGQEVQEVPKAKDCGLLGIFCLTEQIFNAVIHIGSQIFDIYVVILADALKVIAFILQKALLLVIDYFMSMTVIPDGKATPDFVEGAWKFTQAFANSFFILILAFIGLATILRLEAYQFKKTLPALVIVALLINFSGVLVGFIVDIGNIVTNYFLTKASEGNWNTETILPGVPGFTESPKLGLHIVEIIYYPIASLIYFVVMLVFALRAIVLWTLVIVAPIAFAFRILPATKKWWDDWWKQLIQWAFIGIPMSFFLYLASLVLKGGAIGSGKSAEHTALANLMAPFTVLFLLFTGITMSIAMAPAAAKGVINWGKKAGLGTGAWAAREGWRSLARGKGWQKLGENIRKRGQRIPVGDNELTLFEKIPGIGHGIKALGRNPVTRFAARKVGGGIEMATKEANDRIYERDKKTIAAGEKLAKTKGFANAFNEEKVRPPGLWDLSKMLGIITGTIKDGKSSDIQKAIENGELKQSDIVRVYNNAVANGNDEERDLIQNHLGAIELKDKDGKNIYEDTKTPTSKRDALGLPVYEYAKKTFASEFAKRTDEATKTERKTGDRTGKFTYKDENGNEKGIDRPSGLSEGDVKKGYTSFLEKIIAELKPNEIEKQAKNIWNNDAVMEAAHTFWTGTQAGRAATTFGRDFISRLEETKHDAEWYFAVNQTKDDSGKSFFAPRNIAMARYLTSNGAQALGMSPPDGITTSQEVTRRANDAYKEARDSNQKANAGYAAKVAAARASQTPNNKGNTPQNTPQSGGPT